jgi:hypothetical protein
MLVNVTEEVISSEPFMMHHIRTVHRWTITVPGTSFLCVIQECPCGLRDQIGLSYERVDPTDPDWNRKSGKIVDVHSVARAECLCTARSCKLGKSAHKCHGWHRARVDKLISTITKAPKTSRISTSMRSYQRSSA